MKPLSLRARLSLAFALAVALSLGLFGAAVVALMVRSERQEHAQGGPQASDDSTPEELPAVLGFMLLLAPVVAAGAAGVGYLLARRALAPMKEASVRAQAARKAASSELLLPHSGRGDEWDELATTLNALLVDQREALARIQRFTADAAHELRTPLTTIIGEAEVSLRRPRTIEELRKALQVVREEAMRLSGLVDSLLLLAKGDRGILVGEGAALQVDEIVHRAVGHARAVASETPTPIELGPTSSGARVWGNAGLLERAVENLLDNARVHGGPLIRVKVVADQTTVSVEVSDNGPGVPDALRGRMFEAFVRREDGPGSGLGLTLARAIAEAHSGHLSVVPSATGAHFLLQLPSWRADPT